MEIQFRPIVEQIFNNWTGLQLAVEHGMTGPDSKQAALDFVDYIIEYCVNEPNIQILDIQETLEDIMDREFETICEDNSPNEIANLLHKFLILLKDGNLVECQLQYQNLPTCKLWLSKEQFQIQTNMPSHSEEPELDQTQDTAMEECNEWTKVKPRRKK